MYNNIYSTTCLVGRFNAKEILSYQELEKDKGNWVRCTLKQGDLDNLKRKYYPAHLNAMLDTGGDDTSVHRYSLVWNEEKKLILNRFWYDEKDNEHSKDYPCTVRNVSLWFFPYDIILFSIMFDDSGVDLNDLTWMHSKWKEWGSCFDDFSKGGLEKLLQPLAQYVQGGDIRNLTEAGTKIRQYQVVQIDGKELEDELLYEIGTFSRIGVVKDTNPRQGFKPSNDYFKRSIEENVVSVYSNWKALALNDSFTVLAIDGLYADSELDKNCDGYRYFDLLYMRCLFEEYYCFDRNNLFRERGHIDVDKQLEEIKAIERNYFYDDLSYDFLPPLMLRAMEKGLGLLGDRKELTEHIKEAYKERQDKDEQMRRDLQEREERELQRRSDKIVSVVQLLAAFSILGTLYQLIIAMTECERSGWLAGILLAIGLAFFCYFLLKIIRGGKKE